MPIVFFAFAFTLTACGSPKSFDSVLVRGPMHTQQRSQNVNVTAAANAALVRHQAIAFIVGSVHAAEQPPSVPVVDPQSVVIVPTVTTAEPTSLPPEYVCQRESHCTYGINTGNGYFGKWQFHPGTWATGADQWNASHSEQIPNDVSAWSSVQPWMEDAVAAEIWQSGAGCSHWSACG